MLVAMIACAMCSQQLQKRFVSVTFESQCDNHHEAFDVVTTIDDPWIQARMQQDIAPSRAADTSTQ